MGRAVIEALGATVASNPWRSEWITSKSGIVTSLAGGSAGAGYAEAAILICTAITAMAAEVWPGRSKDRRRFAELLVQPHVVVTPATTTISVPLLSKNLIAEGDIAAANLIASTFLPIGDSQVVTSLDVDRTEAQILAVVPSIDKPSLRRNSYANILYEEVRSSYAHEYQPGSLADSWAMTSQPGAGVSYTNNVFSGRRIHFHVPWLVSVAASIAAWLDSVGTPVQRPDPSVWWLDQK